LWSSVLGLLVVFVIAGFRKVVTTTFVRAVHRLWHVVAYAPERSVANDVGGRTSSGDPWRSSSPCPARLWRSVHRSPRTRESTLHTVSREQAIELALSVTPD
jgi:hypothetical protein